MLTGRDAQTIRMDVKLLFLTVALLSSPLLTLCEPLYVLLASNLLRVGSSENVFVEAQDYSGDPFQVKITVMNHPKKNTEILSKSVTLTKDNNFQNLTDIKIPADRNLFSDDPLEKQYVYLQARFPSVILEKVVMLSFQTGYIFIQTDKPIYTPDSTVLYRIFSLMPNLKPFNNTAIKVEIMNPQGITVESYNIHTLNGIKSGTYHIPNVAWSGIWKVVAHFSNTPQKTFTEDFEVKDYVLPTFEVKLKPSKSFFHVDDESLTVDIEAKYLFGPKVEGEAFVVFGVMDGEKKTSIPTSLERVQIVQGEGTVKLTNQTISKSCLNITQLVGQMIYVSVSLLTHSGSEMVKAERRGIQIVTSPYTIHFRKTSQYFKPGRPFDALVYVTNPDQTPAAKVDVEVEVKNNSEVYRNPTNANGIAKFTINTKGGSSTLEITAKTKDRTLGDEQQAVKKMTAHAYITKDGSNNYLHIGIDTADRKIGDSVKVSLNTGVSGQDFTYMILSKGQIVQVNRYKREEQSLVSLSLLVTKDMVPSFRFLAYYHVGWNEVVSDSVRLDVTDTCMETLNLKLKDKTEDTYGTGDEVKLQITGDPGSKVGLVVVDKAVHVLNKNRLSQTQIWDVIEKHDIACTAGGGRDGMGVFTDAGLMFESNTAGGTSPRTVPECTVHAKRKRRADSLLQITSTLADEYSGELKQCCVDGMRENILGYTCEQRATYIVEGEGCVNAFLYCCDRIKTMNKNMMIEEEELILTRSADDEDYYTDSEEITSRTHFPESWFWKVIDLPTCEKCAETSVTERFFLKDSITTWQILAVSLSPTLGICVAEPKEIVVFKSFFIDLKMPYSVVRGEQLEIKAIIHNYSRMDLKVRVELMETEDVCSSASKKGKSRMKVNVKKGSSVPISYVIIPMKLGVYTIEVKASAYDYTDGVKKPLKVVSEGVLTPIHRKNVELNPVKNGEKTLVFKYNTPAHRLPDTDAYTYISIIGEDIAQTIKQAINGNYMGSLLVQPSGCGEQNMFRMTLLVTAINYLDSTNQWETVGMERRNEAINHINTGYQRQLGFRKPDGSYASYRENPGSTWLTAYVSKVFAMASKLDALNDNKEKGVEVTLCSAIKWLIHHKQTRVGSFKEEAALIHSAMTGDDADALLTAFVVIAMQEGKEICAEKANSLRQNISKAVAFLEDRISKLTDPYVVALTSYAMANENKLNKDILIQHSTQEKDDLYWDVPERSYHSQEATAYAVLALIKAKEFDKAARAAHWLSRQQSHYGGYDSTQSTIMAFQALAEYHTQVKDRQNFSLEIDLAMASREKQVKYVIRRHNAHHTRSNRVAINENFNITAKGSGKAILSILSLYYARPTEKKSDCKFFDLTLKMEKDDAIKTNKEDIDTYKLTMEFMYKNNKTDATMTILDIGMPTGFTADENDLKSLSTGKDRYVQKVENNTVLSERGSLILYLDKVSHKKAEKIAFRMHKLFNVGLLQPATVTVYEYYSPDARCTKFYHPERKDAAIHRLCKEDLCQCAEEGCSSQRKHVKDQDRFDKACEHGMDYVYKVKVEEMDLKPTIHIYDMKVEQVLKEGTDVAPVGKNRLFLARPGCKESLGLEKDKSYLIMGQYIDMQNLDTSPQYILGNHTWIENWPHEKSQTPPGIFELEKYLTKTGCTL